MKFLQTFALWILGLRLDQAALAKKLSSPAEKVQVALEVLKLNKENAAHAVRIQMKGLKEYCMEVLKVPSVESLQDYFRWNSEKKKGNIEEMVNHLKQKTEVGNSFTSFLGAARNRYIEYKIRNKGRWKQQPKSYYFKKLKAILDSCMIEDSMSMQEFKDLCMYAYFYTRLSIESKLVPEQKEIKIIQMQPAEEMKAAA